MGEDQTGRDDVTELLTEIAEHLNSIRFHTLIVAIAAAIVVVPALLAVGVMAASLLFGFGEGLLG